MSVHMTDIELCTRGSQWSDYSGKKQKKTKYSKGRKTFFLTFKPHEFHKESSKEFVKEQIDEHKYHLKLKNIHCLSTYQWLIIRIFIKSVYNN